MSSCHSRPLLLILLFFLVRGGDFTDPSQCNSLLDLKRSFRSTHSTLAAWRPDNDCCSWDGVACDPRSGLVTALDLSSHSIAGNLSSSLFNLTSLQKLNLAYNMFDQIPIPTEIGRLANLTSLNLSNAGFIGQIPIGIARLTKLVSLDLSTITANELPETSLRLINPDLVTVISNLSILRELRLDGVIISSYGQQWSSALAKSTPRLEVLSLFGCSITGPIDSSLAELRNLSVIRLDGNQLNCSVPDFFGNFSSLSVLSLGSCGLNGFFPNSVFLLKNLTLVRLARNPMLAGSLPGFTDGSRLQSLDLSGTMFSGYLPDSIGKLKNLRSMCLSDCQFSESIPSSIGNLSQLVELDLSLNNFSGLIPPSVANLGRLMKLDLSNNSLSGSIPGPLFALPLLQEMRLNMNQLSGRLEEFSNRSSRLGIVDLSNNDLQGEIPRSVFQLSGLKILALGSNSLRGTLELNQFAALGNLSSLDLSYNAISIQEDDGNDSMSLPRLGTLMLASCNLTRVPSFLRYQNQMSSLDLSNNRISGAIPNWIWSISNTTLSNLNLCCNFFTSVEGPLPDFNEDRQPIILDLHSNLLEGSIPLPPLSTVVLDYSNNSFSSLIPSNITSYLVFTVFFSLAHNNLTGEIPSSICNASYLQVLDLSDNELTGQIPSCFFEGGNALAILDLRGNMLTGRITQNISKECRLRTINLNGNRLEGKIPRALPNCNELEVLDVGNNHLSGPFPFWLGDMFSLCVLVLRSNELSGPLGPHPGSQIPSDAFSVLQIFDISSNNFSGPLHLDCFKKLKAMMKAELNVSNVQFRYLQLHPSYYQNTITVTSKGMDMTLVRILTLFTSLDFSDNSFEGSIPDVIGDLQSLYVLNFSHNALTGSIPLSIRNLKQLESLDLSNNQLSGTIPPGLDALTFLSYLNLSCNNLVGRIPQGNQLSTFSHYSFEGNKGLCGLPLTLQCSNSSGDSPLQPNLSAFTTEVNWQFIFVGIGFGGGLAMVLGTLMSWEFGRNWYMKKVDGMLWAIIPSAFLRLCDYFENRRVAAEDGMDADSKELDGSRGRKFCVFCTRLVLSQGRARVHHVECDCPLEVE